ncbi:K02A2.6-like [Cordylochernes scorpioides]|uniref:RNA-directed DNA polymerase n=1 Tax=Cordylochernes scorpioides TaxID=51811 RepID=A0ABY6L026_9ARAC|nr:K02A2.6-like [Cordylochernes scorpioides]
MSSHIHVKCNSTCVRSVVMKSNREFENRAAVIVALRAGRSPKEIVDFLKLPKTTIYRVKKQFDEADSNKEGIATRKKHSRRSDRSYALRKGQLLTENMKNNRKGKAAALLNNLKHDSFGMLRFFSDEKNFDVDQKSSQRAMVLDLTPPVSSQTPDKPMLVEMYGEKCMDIKNVRKWCREFNEGRINVHDEQRSGRPSLPESTVARIDEMVSANRRITLEEIEDGLNEDCSHFSVHKIVSETLGYRKVSASRNVMSLQSTLDKGFEMKMDKKGCKLYKTTTREVIVEEKRLPGGLYGKDNRVADFLSRIPCSNDLSTLEDNRVVAAVTIEQGSPLLSNDEVWSELKRDPKWSPLITRIETRGNWVKVIPRSLINRVMGYHHNIASAGHFGVRKTLRRLRSEYFWPRMRTEVQNYIRRDQTAGTVVKALVDRVITHHGVPKTVLSDRGSAFISQVFKGVCKALGISAVNTTAWRPQSNGAVERQNRTEQESEEDEEFCSTNPGFVNFFYPLSKSAVPPSSNQTAPVQSSDNGQNSSAIRRSTHTQGLLRVGGRLKYSYLNENQKFPLLQPKSPRQESLIKNLLTENADIPEAIDENQEDSSILETTFIIEDEESNKDIGTPKIEISEVSVIDKSEGKYLKEPVVSVEALDKKELCHDDSAHLNVVEADLNRPKEATSGIINVYTEANESSSKEKVVPVEIVDTSTKDYLQSGEKAKLSRWKPIDSLCLEDVKESEDDDENYSSSAYIEWPEILKKEVLRPEALEKAVNLEDFEKAAESRQLSKEHLEESTEQGSCIKAESKPWEDPIESDLAAAESDNPAVPERELANESENIIQDSPQSDTQRWKLIPLPFKQ